MSSLFISTGAALCGIFLLFLVGWRVLGSKRLSLPPGPQGYPVIGNLFDLPKGHDWLTYSKWQNTYGDMIHITVLGKSILILNSVKTAADLLEKRSAIYSGRMPFTMGGELVGHDRGFAATEGEIHRDGRKIAHRGLNSTAVTEWQTLQEDAALKTLQKLRETPNDFVKHFHFNAGSSIMRVIYGYEVEGDDDPLLRHANMVLEDFSQLIIVGKWMVDVLPFLKHVPAWVPGAGFKRLAQKLRADVDKFYNDPFNFVKKHMADGTALPCMVAQLLETTEHETDEVHIRNAVGSLYTGGVDTTPSVLTGFVLAMTLYPEAQKKAQEELDHIVGNDRLPKLADRSSLLYINAVVKEVLRWSPVAPLGVPHRLIKEDEYNGYRLPKDTVVVTNIWHMSRDVATYGPDVDSFRPERFLGADPTPRGVSTSNTNEFGSPVFGFGRRVCPGEYLAFGSLFIMCSNILATMDIVPVLDAVGKPLRPAVEYDSGVLTHPRPFKCNIMPRSAKAVELMNGAP